MTELFMLPLKISCYFSWWMYWWSTWGMTTNLIHESVAVLWWDGLRTLTWCWMMTVLGIEVNVDCGCQTLSMWENDMYPLLPTMLTSLNTKIPRNFYFGWRFFNNTTSNIDLLIQSSSEVTNECNLSWNFGWTCWIHWRQLSHLFQYGRIDWMISSHKSWHLQTKTLIWRAECNLLTLMWSNWRHWADNQVGELEGCLNAMKMQ